MYRLIWDDGLGNLVQAFYATEAEVRTQADYDAGRPGGPQLKHILDPDGVVLRAWGEQEQTGTQDPLPPIDLAVYADEVTNGDLPAGPEDQGSF